MAAISRVVALFLLVALGTHAAHMVELKQRDVPSHEKRQILELLQLGEEDQSKVPNIQLNTNFFGHILIGEDKQEFEVVFDTGSDALWVYSDSCSSCKESKKHVFNRKSSTTYHEKQLPFSIKYGTGESHGTTGTDMMRLGDLEVIDQDFGQCDQPDNVMKGFPFDGIVGLSRPMFQDPNGLSPIMTTVKHERMLEEKKLANTFSFYLGREETEKSYLIFGGSHHMLHEGAVHWVPAMSKNIFWELPLDDILIHQKQGSNISMNEQASESISLERHFADLAVHDPFANMMARTHQAAQEQQHTHHHQQQPHTHQHKRHEAAPDAEVAGLLNDMPGVSEDGYKFFSTAEPVLLELESTLSTLKSQTNRKPHHVFKQHLKPIASHHTSLNLEEDPLSETADAHEVLGLVADVDDFAEKSEKLILQAPLENNKSHADVVTNTPHHQQHSHSAPKQHKQQQREQEQDAHQHSEMTATHRTITPTTTTTTTTKATKLSSKKVSTTAPAPRASTPKTSTKETVAKKEKKADKQQTAEVGGGELLSDVTSSPGVSISPCQQDLTHPCILSMDSGHSLISGPPELVRHLKQFTTPAEGIECTEQATTHMPDVSFVIGGKLFTLNPMDYLIELEGRCMPAFRERAFRNGHDWVLGEHFMRTFYSVFDYDDMRVGLARVKDIKQHLDTILTRS